MIDELDIQLRKAIAKVGNARPLLYYEDCGCVYMARKIAGVFTYGGDRDGHRNVYCFVENGPAIVRVMKSASSSTILRRVTANGELRGQRSMVSGMK